MSGTPPARRSLVILFLLYFAQGLPFGFQKELAAFLRQAGMSLTNITLARGLSVPWLLKALWAPLVDRYGSASFGRRKSWIVPLQLLLAATFVGASFFPPEVSLPALVGLSAVSWIFAGLLAAGVAWLAQGPQPDAHELRRAARRSSRPRSVCRRWSG